MPNLLSWDVAADMALVCRLEQVDASGDDDGRIGLMKNELLTIKLKTGAKPLCLTTTRRVPFPLRDAVKAERNNMVESGVIRSVTEPTDWCAAMVPVIKKTGAVRICVDLKQLNTSVRREHHLDFMHFADCHLEIFLHPRNIPTQDVDTSRRSERSRSDHGRHPGSWSEQGRIRRSSQC